MKTGRDPAGAEVTIRLARPSDQRSLERLAQLDSRSTPAGPVLVAEVDGELRAALPLGDGGPVADPFVPTAPLISLLALRAAQVHQLIPRAAPTERARGKRQLSLATSH